MESYIRATFLIYLKHTLLQNSLKGCFILVFCLLVFVFQTKIYEADYKIEHKDHERMLQENKRLRRREGEMRQQMVLLQEQVSWKADT